MKTFKKICCYVFLTVLGIAFVVLTFGIGPVGWAAVFCFIVSCILLVVSVRDFVKSILRMRNQ